MLGCMVNQLPEKKSLKENRVINENLKSKYDSTMSEVVELIDSISISTNTKLISHGPDGTATYIGGQHLTYPSQMQCQSMGYHENSLYADISTNHRLCGKRHAESDTYNGVKYLNDFSAKHDNQTYPKSQQLNLNTQHALCQCNYTAGYTSPSNDFTSMNGNICPSHPYSSGINKASVVCSDITFNDVCVVQQQVSSTSEPDHPYQIRQSLSSEISDEDLLEIIGNVQHRQLSLHEHTILSEFKLAPSLTDVMPQYQTNTISVLCKENTSMQHVHNESTQPLKIPPLIQSTLVAPGMSYDHINSITKQPFQLSGADLTNSNSYGAQPGISTTSFIQKPINAAISYPRPSNNAVSISQPPSNVQYIPEEKIQVISEPRSTSRESSPQIPDQITPESRLQTASMFQPSSCPSTLLNPNHMNKESFEQDGLLNPNTFMDGMYEIDRCTKLQIEACAIKKVCPLI